MTGFVCLYKPKDMTSFGAVARVRRIMGEKKAGHCGTLDPMATGVLPIMLGGATRFLDFLPSSKKRYTAVMRLGITTDTLDITGEVLSETPVDADFARVCSAAEKFKGDIMQIPPMYSAIKKDGVRMYDLARKGIEVEREARPVTIFRLDVFEEFEGVLLHENEYVLDVECSSGTYIRTLIDDIGRELGCGAVMTSLKRTQSSGFVIENAVTIEDLEKAAENGDAESVLTSVFDAMAEYDVVTVSEGQAKRFANGGALNLERVQSCKGDGLYRVVSPAGEFLGLGRADAQLRSLSVARVYVGR